MKLLLKETIRANGVRYLPKSIVDTAEIGITDADAEVLVRRGTASVVEAEAAEVAEVKQPDTQAEVVEPETVAVDGEPVAKPAAKTAAKSKN
jgi:hypothetical protein